MPEWYYRDRHENTVGPLNSGELLQLIRDGELTDETLVRKDDSHWVRSVEVNGLWQAAARPVTEFHCPVCNTALSKPPCRCPKCLKYVDKAVGKIQKPTINAKHLAKIRETASQSLQIAKSPNCKSSNSISIEQQLHDAKVAPPAAKNAARWWHAILPKKK